MGEKSRIIAELLAALRSGDSKVQGELLKRYEPLLKVLAAASPSPSKVAIEAEREVLPGQALEKLSPDYREVIILHNMQSLSHDEVAERMGRTPGAVRVLWVRALAQLRKTLNRMVRQSGI